VNKIDKNAVVALALPWPHWGPHRTL